MHAFLYWLGGRKSGGIYFPIKDLTNQYYVLLGVVRYAFSRNFALYKHCSLLCC